MFDIKCQDLHTQKSNRSVREKPDRRAEMMGQDNEIHLKSKEAEKVPIWSENSLCDLRFCLIMIGSKNNIFISSLLINGSYYGFLMRIEDFKSVYTI